MNKDNENIFSDISRKWGFIAVIFGFPAFIILEHFWYRQKGIVSLYSIGIIILSFRIS
jgi:hypothetical protein